MVNVARSQLKVSGQASTLFSSSFDTFSDWKTLVYRICFLRPSMSSPDQYDTMERKVKKNKARNGVRKKKSDV